MQKVVLELPAMYGDHHVTEVRRLLLELQGVVEVYASSAFGVVEVTYDPASLKEEDILAKLSVAGYLGDLQVPVEVDAAALSGNGRENSKAFMRHSEVYENTRQSVSFGQVVSYLGRPLWPCPGMGVIKPMEE
jgi:copper chaperone CopZ